MPIAEQLSHWRRDGTARCHMARSLQTGLQRGNRVRARLVFALTALVTVFGVAAWALAAHNGAAQPSPDRSIISNSTPRTLPSSSPSAAVAPQAAGMRLVFDQHFPGHRLNTAVWTTCYPWVGASAGCTNFGNPEYEWYLPSQDRVSGGALHLVAQRIPTLGSASSGKPKWYSCRSGIVTSYPSLRFKYGYVSYVAKLPAGSGLWSGLWLAAANLKWPPEIDLVERWGQPKDVAGVYFHPTNGSVVKVHLTPAVTASLGAGWHTYGVSWTSKRVIWYVDGQQMMVVRKHVPHQLMYLVANLAYYELSKVGGCSGQALIRSVEVWQQ